MACRISISTSVGGSMLTTSGAGGWARREEVGGGERPANVTVETKPAFCSSCARWRCSLLGNMDVIPSRAFEAFWRWEQT